MAKTIIIKLRKAGARTSVFSLSDNLGNTLATGVSKNQLISGMSFTVDDVVSVITIVSEGDCSKSYNISIGQYTVQEVVNMQFEEVNTASVWTHLTDVTIYNKYYGVTSPYIIEYPFAYQYQDEIVQNVKDYTKAFVYLPPISGVFDETRKIETNDKYFNKAVLYNNQQSSGILELVAKPVNNLSLYLTYPKFNTDSKTITYTKSDNFYQYNNFWSIVRDRTIPLFTNSCTSLSIDKEVNQDNMDYSTRSFRKDTIRAKELKVRHILDNTSDVHLVSQFILTPSQISYK